MTAQRQRKQLSQYHENDFTQRQKLQLRSSTILRSWRMHCGCCRSTPGVVVWLLLVIDTVVNAIVVNAKSMVGYYYYCCYLRAIFVNAKSVAGYHYDCCSLRAILSVQSQWLAVIIVIVDLRAIVVSAKSMAGCYYCYCCYLRAILSMQSQWLVIIISELLS